MKIFRALIFFSAVAAVISSAIFWKETSFSVPSKYEKQIIKKIEFFGMTKKEGGEIVYGPLLNKTPEELAMICTSYVGDPLSSSVIEQDIKLISTQANMVDVKVYVSETSGGVILSFYCEEGPVVSGIVLRGNDQLKLEDITAKLPFREGDPFRQDLVDAGSRIVLNYLIQEKGLFNAVVTYSINSDSKNHTNRNVVYTIDEGEDIRVGRINILGANKIYEKNLRSLMTTKPYAKLDQGNFKRDKFDEDKQKIVMYYKSLGYLDADIAEENIKMEWNDPEKTSDRELFITLKLKEGDKYYFDGYELEGNVLISSDTIRSKFILPGENPAPPAEGQDGSDDIVFDDIKFQQDRMSVGMEYANIGHVFARIMPEKSEVTRVRKVGNKTESRKFLHYTFHVVEGKPVNVESIIIKGNKKTKTKVIRRQVILNEGELYSQAKLNLSRERIYSLGFFKEVNIDIRPGSSDERVNLIITVAEQATGNISMGGGISTNSGFSIQAKVGENNLMGYGHKIEAGVEYGVENTSISLSYTWPWFMDTPVDLVGSIFYKIYQSDTATPYFDDIDENNEYKQISYGYSTGIYYRFWLYYGVGVKWIHSWKDVTEVSGNCSDEIMKVQAVGLQEKRNVSLNLYYNSLDHPMLTTKGLNLDLNAAFVGGGILGGSDHYIEYTATLDYYMSPFSLPFLPKYRCVIELRGSGDFITPPMMKRQVAKRQNNNRDPWLDESDRLYLGGAETLRGWDYDDSDFPQSWQDKLYHRVLYSAEFRVPIHPEYVWTSFFFDAGSLWSDKFWERYAEEEQAENIASDRAANQLYSLSEFRDANLMKYFRYSWGFGVRIQIPMMPLRFWWGQKMRWEGLDKGRFDTYKGFNFQFQIGDIRF